MNRGLKFGPDGKKVPIPGVRKWEGGKSPKKKTDPLGGRVLGGPAAEGPGGKGGILKNVI